MKELEPVINEFTFFDSVLFLNPEDKERLEGSYSYWLNQKRLSQEQFAQSRSGLSRKITSEFGSVQERSNVGNKAV